jgi:inorganic pyrophosphatase
MTDQKTVAVFNPWHHVEIGEQYPEVVQAVIEIGKGTKGKYELDKKTGMLRLDRVLPCSSHYPANYGFIPQTLGEDNDPMDILVLSQVAIQPMCIINARVIGVMRMIDENEGDDKIIAVACGDNSVAHLNQMSDLPLPAQSELRHFFEEYKKLENKVVIVEKFEDADAAKEIIRKSVKNYQHNFINGSIHSK